MLNRQRDEIIRDVLQTTMNNPEGVGISGVMFKAYLCHSQAKAYLSELLSNGLVENTTTALGRNYYKATPKGIEYLAAINNMTEMISVESMRRAKDI